MENELESIVDSLENMILLKAEKEPLAYKDEELVLKVNNISKLLDKGYDTISVYTKKYKSSFGDAKLVEDGQK